MSTKKSDFFKKLIPKNNKFLKTAIKLAPKWNKKTVLILAAVLTFIFIVGIANPGHIVQKSLGLVGIETESNEISQTNEPREETSVMNEDDKQDGTENNSEKKVGTSDGSSSDEKEAEEPSGSHTVITPEDIQKHKGNGEPYLIQGTDWKVKVNSRSPQSCGISSNPCSIGQQAVVNVSAYNTHTNQLLPITECNGTAGDVHAPSNPTPTSLPDSNHCELRFTPTNSGQYWFQIELYLSKTVYTDTIYWGGWVWDGFFVN